MDLCSVTFQPISSADMTLRYGGPNLRYPPRRIFAWEGFTATGRPLNCRFGFV